MIVSVLVQILTLTFRN